VVEVAGTSDWVCWTAQGVPQEAPPPPVTPPVVVLGRQRVAYSNVSQAAGKTSFAYAKQYLTGLAPSWWAPSIAGDGQVVLQSNATEDTAYVADAVASGVGVWGVIANYYPPTTGWTFAPVHTIINNPTLVSVHIAALVDLAVTKGYVGIDIDYEHADVGGVTGDRAPFTAFIQSLAASLHAESKLLSVVVQPKLNEPGTGAKQQVQDWDAIGSAADQVRVMLYDYDPNAGAASQSPYSWWQDMISYAPSRVRSSKLLLGAPTYGYQWNTGNPTAVTDIVWSDAETLRGANPIQYDTAEEAPHFTYSSGTKQIYYENAQSLAARARLVSQYDLAGIFFWRLGNEDPTLWQAVDAALAKPTSSVTIRLFPSQDCWIDANTQTTAKGGAATNLIVKSSLERRTLLSYDLSPLPSGAVITAATLTLLKTSFTGTDPAGHTYALDQVTRPYVEDVDDTPTPSTKGATWLQADVANAVAWTTPGGDYTTGDRVLSSVPAGTNTPMVFSSGSLVNQATYAYTQPDRAMRLVIHDTTVPTTNGASVFRCRESATVDERPTLTITYTP
jgi:spore germination protein YaaH